MANLRSVGENHGGVGAGAACEVRLVGDAAGLGAGVVGVSEGPGQLGRGGAVRHDAVVDGALVLRIRATVDGKILGEDVDGLIAGAAEAVGEDVAGVAVLHAIVIKRARVRLSARGSIGTLVNVGRGDRGTGRNDNSMATVHLVDVSSSFATGIHKGVRSGDRARHRGANAGGIAGKLNLAQVSGRSAGEQSRNNSGQEHHFLKEL